MATYCTASGVRLAPHGKMTMTPQLFARKFAAGPAAGTALAR
jgi:D-serine deaminase-like pyridoxal phosphate-dependent protein